MKVINRKTQAVLDVSDEFGAKLIKSDLWIEQKTDKKIKKESLNG